MHHPEAAQGSDPRAAGARADRSVQHRRSAARHCAGVNAGALTAMQHLHNNHNNIDNIAAKPAA